jgi:hypothetical protein
MKSGRNRKTSPRLQKTLNPGPEENARSYRVGNPSGIESRTLPRGRGDTANDHSETEKQNQ